MTHDYFLKLLKLVMTYIIAARATDIHTSIFSDNTETIMYESELESHNLFYSLEPQSELLL